MKPLQCLGLIGHVSIHVTFWDAESPRCSNRKDFEVDSALLDLITHFSRGFSVSNPRYRGSNSNLLKLECFSSSLPERFVMASRMPAISLRVESSIFSDLFFFLL